MKTVIARRRRIREVVHERITPEQQQQTMRTGLALQAQGFPNRTPIPDYAGIIGIFWSTATLCYVLGFCSRLDQASIATQKVLWELARDYRHGVKVRGGAHGDIRVSNIRTLTALRAATAAKLAEIALTR